MSAPPHTHEPLPRHYDLRLTPPALAVWAAAGTLIGATPTIAYTVAGAAALLAALLLTAAHPPTRLAQRPPGGVRWEWKASWVVVAVLAGVAASAAGTGMRLSAIGSGPVRELARAGSQTSLDAVVTADPQVRPAAARKIVLVRARAEKIRVRGRPVGVRVPVLLIASDQRWRDLVPSHRVRLTARLSLPRHAELLAAVGLVRGPPTLLEPPSSIQRIAETIRAKLREASAGLPADQRGVLPGMVVGDTSRLDQRVADDFKAAGLTHLLVVSGANLAIVAGAIMALCRFAGLGRRRAPLLAALALLAFVVVARPEPSVLRATVMSLIGLLAYFTGRERQGLPALSAAVLLLVLADPGLGRSYGFALSVVATASLLVLAPPWRDRLQRRMPRPLAEALAVSAAAQIACAPVLVMLTGDVSLVSVAANLLAAPAVPPATLLGALAAAIAPAAMPLAKLLVWPAGLAVGWIVGVARTAAALPYSTLPWQDGGLGAAVLLAVLAVAVIVLRSRPLRILAAALVAGAILAVATLRLTAPRWPPPGWLFVACDVGQGDASVLSAGPGQAVVVDAGPDPQPVDGCLSRLGVRAVPLLVLTHPHADHIDGVPGVRRGRAVSTVVTSPLSHGREHRLIAGLDTRAAAPGQQWTVGELSLSVLGPLTSTQDGDGGSAVNNASVVLVARRPGFSALLTGDVETEAQRALAASVPPVQLLKVPHHGSRSQDSAFLTAARATISVTSAGKDNDYGHPAPATLALLHRLGMRIHRTDREGDIAIVRTQKGLAVITSRHP